jgi:hypothetical protein
VPIRLVVFPEGYYLAPKNKTLATENQNKM